MKLEKKQGWLAIIIIAAVLIIDQIIKIEVKTNMYLGERIRITDWFYIFFVENKGMAFGWELFEKRFLTIFRIIFVGLMGWYMHKQIKQGLQSTGFIVCLSLVIAGAAGNIIDSLFYGLIFNSPDYPMVADFVPFGEGYESFMMGRVVDMFYFPLIEWDMLNYGWLPYAGEHCIFFSPIFNFADASISCGMIALILFYHKEVSEIGKKEFHK